jgi:hypothetical protein
MTSFDNVVDATRQNANSGSELASAAGQIIAKRVALGVAAIIDPMRADHAELGRMVPEKIEAFSAAGIILRSMSHWFRPWVLYQPTHEPTVLAYSRVAIDRMRSGAAISLFQALQQASTRASYVA